MKKLFLTDIDNTLIYSYKHAKGGDVCVETIHDKPQGYMPPYAYENLAKVGEGFEIVPVTTRSTEQYNRINFPLDIERAVVANGGLLLCKDKADEAWNKAVKESVLVFEKLQELEKELQSTDMFLRVRTVDGIYLFAYCKDNVKPSYVVEKYSERIEGVSVMASGKKVYFLPSQINKGRAAEKIKQMIDPDITVSAGDSEMDIPMLNTADVAIVPKDFPTHLLKDGLEIIVCDTDNFPDFVVKALLEKIKA